ncbi:MAG: GAF domain-containing protein [Phycisphaerales bacterium]|nr:GAF domain-containing protein [Phycisphaerales bacterium]
MQTTNRRDYSALIDSISTVGSREQRMRAVADAIWSAHAQTGVSWVGFYFATTEPEAAGKYAPSEDAALQLVLGPCRNKPACSPIGLHGACGRCFLSGAPLVVRDVRELGANYIACDPRDHSEVVVPCTNENGKCWGVLDLDSFEVGAFDHHDVDGLTLLLRTAGLTHVA